jgi:hypothetical protein
LFFNPGAGGSYMLSTLWYDESRNMVKAEIELKAKGAVLWA